jgi:eukaryotic-like serine/threonine-protein kinase
MPADEPDDLSALPQHDSLMKQVALSVAPPASALPLALPPGRKLGDRYVVLRPIGSGGMGEVYLARDVTLQREVAIKRHRHGREVDRLRREAIAMARLAHPNVVTVFEVGEIDGGAFVAMEYVPGTTLRGWLAEQRRTPKEILAMLRMIGEGLAAAHAAGIVHRDFKPENVLIGVDGRARVSDFGLARDARAAAAVAAAGGDDATTLPAQLAATAAAGSDDGLAPTLPVAASATAATVPALGRGSASGARADGQEEEEAAAFALAASADAELARVITLAGTVMGTPAYMAPEQAAGGAVDARADQFAFCVVAWEALFGARPVAGRGAASQSTALGEAATLGRGRQPRRLRAALSRGLSVDPERRHPDLRALLAGAALAAAGVLTWQLTRERPLQCDDAGAEIAALEVPSLPPASAALVAGRLEELRHQFRAAAGGACRARRDGGWSAELYLRARGCLEVQRQLAHGQLASLTAPSSGSRAPLPAGLTAALATGLRIDRALPLPAPAMCGDATQLASWPPPPSSRDLAAAASLRAALELAHRSLVQQERGTAVALVEAVAKNPLAAAPFVAARLALLRGLLAITGDDLPGGQPQLAAAHAAATAAGDVETQLFASAEEIATAGERRLDRAAAEQLITAAVAEADGLASRAPEAAARVYLAAARIVRDEPPATAPLDEAPEPPATDHGTGDGGDAATISFPSSTSVQPTTRGADRAAALIAKAIPLLDDARLSPLRITAHQLRASVQLAIGRFGDARADQLRALELARALYGPDHPRVAGVAAECALELSGLPVATEAHPCASDARRILALPALPSIDAARAHLDLAQLAQNEGAGGSALKAAGTHFEAARQLLLALGVRDLELVAADAGLALARLDAHRPAEALPFLDEALAIQQRILGTDHLALGATYYNLTIAHRDRGDLPAARRHAELAVAIYEARRDVDHHRFALALLAEVANRAGDPQAALDATAKAARWTRAADPTSLAWPRLERARALIAIGELGPHSPPRQLGEAVQLLIQARSLYDVMQSSQRVQEIDRLLAQLGTRAPR